jgi:hypothetical protein
MLDTFAEAIADMRVRQKVLGVCGIVFDLNANLPDKGAQILQLISLFWPPDGPK